MKPRTSYLDVRVATPPAEPLRLSSLGSALGRLVRRCVRSLSPGGGSGDPGGRHGQPPRVALALATPGDGAAESRYVYPPFLPSYHLARPTQDPDEDPDQPDPPPSSGYRDDLDTGPFARLLRVLRNVFGGDPPGQGLPPWKG
jgi:hypothetical protein